MARIRDGRVTATSLHAASSLMGSRFFKKTEQEMLSTWKVRYSLLPLARVQRFWQRVMLWALQQRDHNKALVLLEATISDVHNTAGATRYAIEDALEFLVSKHLEGQIADMEINARLCRLFCTFAQMNHLGNDRTSESVQKVIYWLLQHSDYHQTVTLYDSIVNSLLRVDIKTLTHFLNKFVQLGRTDMAMDVLRRIATSSADVTSSIVQHSCIKLLRTSLNDAEGYRTQSHLVTEMLEFGIRPGIPMLNAMILNAVEAGDHQTAYAIFETARIHGVRRNTITYSIILKIALHNLDENLVGRIMLMAEEDGALPRNNQLVYCLLSTFMQISRSESEPQQSNPWESKYRTMVRIYTRYCDISPLQDLGIYVDVLRDSGTTGPTSPPSPQLLSVMIMGYVRFCGQPSPIRALYHRYQRLLAQNHPLIAPTAGTDHLANAFLLRLGQRRHTFAMCPIIIKNMLEPPPSTVFKVAEPTVQTWSILLRSYFFNGQRAAAEKTIQMMRSRGIAPNVVTMNTIIAGYAAMQDAAAAANTMQDMKAAGFENDSSTYKALTRIVKRERLLDALRKTAVKTTQAWGVGQAGEGSSSVEVEGALDTATPSLETASLPALQASGSKHDSLFGGPAQQEGNAAVNGAFLRSVGEP